MDLLQFPEDFVERYNTGDIFNLPPGDVQVGQALMEAEGILRSGTIRVGGPQGQVIDAGSVPRALFLEALAKCHHSGQVRLPSDDDTCHSAVSRFNQYSADMQRRWNQLVGQYTSDQRREPAITNALMSKTLQWTRP